MYNKLLYANCNFISSVAVHTVLYETVTTLSCTVVVKYKLTHVAIIQVFESYPSISATPHIIFYFFV